MKIKNVAVLLTCHNRKNKTISCLYHLFEAVKSSESYLDITVFLTDDGSVDNTEREVKELFPSVNVLKGSGRMYWSGGMRNSWKEALKVSYDAYLLLNDDTNVSYNLFPELKICHEYAITNFNSSGIYVGSTHDGKNNLTYGGSVIISKFLNKYRPLVPNGRIQKCDLGNGNIMLVTQEVVEKIGIFSEDYTHGIADFDYTLTAKKNDIPVLVAADYCGICINDNLSHYDKFAKLSFKDRKDYLYHPTGLAFSDQVKFMRKFYPFRLPFFFAAALVKLFSPNFYIAINKYR